MGVRMSPKPIQEEIPVMKWFRGEVVAAMKCGGCNNSIRVGCSYDVTKLQCPITGEINGFFDECDITERQKLIWLLSGKSIDTPSDVEYVADWLLSNGISVL